MNKIIFLFFFFISCEPSNSIRSEADLLNPKFLIEEINNYTLINTPAKDYFVSFLKDTLRDRDFIFRYASTFVDGYSLKQYYFTEDELSFTTYFDSLEQKFGLIYRLDFLNQAMIFSNDYKENIDLNFFSTDGNSHLLYISDSSYLQNLRKAVISFRFEFILDFLNFHLVNNISSNSLIDVFDSKSELSDYLFSKYEQINLDSLVQFDKVVCYSYCNREYDLCFSFNKVNNWYDLQHIYIVVPPFFNYPYTRL